MDGCNSPKCRDPTIKLFGRKILLPESQIPAKPISTEIVNALTKPDGCLSSSMSVKEEHKVSSEPNGLVVNCQSKEEQSQAVDGTEQEKVFKKPDKILPCRRCNSLDTKFCYFNNYNVNQPRHFCKNCQRYWTAGGTMRNVPVGAGRRKNKQFASQYRQILVSSDGKPLNNIETADSDNNQIVSSVGNGTVLKFGSEAPLCQSMDTVLQHRDHQKNVSAVTGAVNNADYEQELSACGSSINVLRKEQTNLASNGSDATQQSSLPFYPVPPWSLPLNAGWNSVAALTKTDGGNMNPLQFCPTPMLAMPGGFPPNIPLQFVPSSYFTCRPVLGDSSFSAAPNGHCLMPFPSATNSSSMESSGSPTLGKHSRDSTSTEEMQMGKYILVPKMMKIDDRDAASKTPIWASFGVLPKQVTCSPKDSGFNGLDTEIESTHVLEANPAALSRSHTFQEHT